MDRNIFCEKFINLDFTRRSEIDIRRLLHASNLRSERECDRRLKAKDDWLKVTIAMEEMSELQKELSKYLRGEGDRIGILEEIADVYIMLGSLVDIFERDKDIDITRDDIKKAAYIKLDRLASFDKKEGEDK